MKKKNLIVIVLASTALAIGGGVALTSLMAPKAIEVKAATETTVYLAIDSATLSTYTVKLNINQQGQGGDAWATHVMTNTGKTYDSKPVFACTFTDLWNGLQTMQFQLYNGDSWVEENEVFKNSWTGPSTYNGKLHVYKGTGDTWVNYERDIENSTLYLTQRDGWEAPLYAYAWRGDKTNKAWPGVEMTKVSTNEFGEEIYSISGITGYSGIIFSDKNGKQTVNGNADSFGADNACWLGNADGDGKFAFEGHYSYSPDRGRLTTWANTFIEAEDLCNGSGDEWADFATTYAALGPGAQAYFATAQVTANKDGNNLEKAAYRYERGVAVKNQTAFAESQRPKTGFQANYSAALKLSSNNMQGGATSAIAVTAAVGAAAAVGFFFIRKKKAI